MLPGYLTLHCSIIRANAFIVKNLVLMTKKYFDRKKFEITSIINTKIYTSALENCESRNAIVPKRLTVDCLE